MGGSWVNKLILGGRLVNCRNINKKGIMLSYISKVKVIVLAYKRKNYIV
jgi:hypothetical protein